MARRKSRKVSKSRKSSNRKVSSRRRTRKKSGSKKGIMKPVPISKALQKVLCVPSNTARTEVNKKIWIYIKKHKLQDKNDGRVIILNDTLASLFGKKKGTKVHTFKEMPKLLKKHFL